MMKLVYELMLPGQEVIKGCNRGGGGIEGKELN